MEWTQFVFNECPGQKPPILPAGICLFSGYLYQVSVETEKRSRVTLVALRLACMLGLVLRINLRIIIRTFN